MNGRLKKGGDRSIIEIEITTEDEDSSFIAIDKDGNAIRCFPLFSFECDEIGKTFLFFTDYSMDEDGETRVSVSEVIPDPDAPRLVPVTGEKELDFLERIMDIVLNDILGIAD